MPWCSLASKSYKALCGCLITRFAGSDQSAVGDHVRQEAVVQHCLQELQGSLRQRSLLAGTDHDAVGDHVWQEALGQDCLQEFKGSLRQRTLLAGMTKAL